MLGDYLPTKASTLLIPSGTATDPGRHHLFFLVTNRCPNGLHLAVSLSSIETGRVHDSTCLLTIGDHPFVTRDSFIVYRMARLLHHEGIKKCVDSKVYIAKEDCDAAVLKRIADGVTQSPFTPKWAKQYFLENFDR
jgi:hypothetical protein